MANIRVCFAPSPTDCMHVGNTQIALINYIFAKKMDGEFVFRVDDIKMSKHDKDLTEQITSDLVWLKLDWNEGPNKGGKYGPYRQSLRSKIYQEHINILIDKGMVYPCYCTEEDLEQRRRESLSHGQTDRYDNKCRFLSDADRLELENKGIKPVWRFKIEPTTLVITDLLQGDLAFDTALMGDFVVMDSDQTPTTDFAVAVDNTLMEISHVICGKDDLSRTPRHTILCNAFGYPVPLFVHIPLVEIEKKSENKFDDFYTVTGLREKGYLPEALVNYLINLVLSCETGTKIQSMEELIEQFSIEYIQNESRKFDVKILNEYGAHYIRCAELVRLTDLAIPYLKQAELIGGNIDEEYYGYLTNVVDVIRKHVSCLSEMTIYAGIFFKDSVEISEEKKKILTLQNSKNIIEKLLNMFTEEGEYTKESCKTVYQRALQETNISEEEFYKIVRWALTGIDHGPELSDIFWLLGKQKVLNRLTDILR